MLNKVYASTPFGIAAIILIALGAMEFYKDNIAPRFKM